jgi:cytochrome b561
MGMNLGSKTKYSGFAMLLHWTVVVLVIAQWQIAEAAEEAATREAAGQIMTNHFAIGVVIFLVMALRLVWRQASPPPPVQGHAVWERKLSKTVHFAFYALLLLMPLAGWIALSSFGEPIDLWGLLSPCAAGAAEPGPWRANLRSAWRGGDRIAWTDAASRACGAQALLRRQGRNALPDAAFWHRKGLIRAERKPRRIAPGGASIW